MFSDALSLVLNSFVFAGVIILRILLACPLKQSPGSGVGLGVKGTCVLSLVLTKEVSLRMEAEDMGSLGGFTKDDGWCTGGGSGCFPFDLVGEFSV
jgi:hypothetical protein